MVVVFLYILAIAYSINFDNPPLGPDKIIIIGIEMILIL